MAFVETSPFYRGKGQECFENQIQSVLLSCVQHAGTQEKSNHDIFLKGERSGIRSKGRSSAVHVLLILILSSRIYYVSKCFFQNYSLLAML